VPFLKAVGKDSKTEETMESGSTDPAIKRLPFYDCRTGRPSGHRFVRETDPGRSTTGAQAHRRVVELLRAAESGGEGLDCILHITHVELLHLKPDIMAGLLQGCRDPQRMRVAIPLVPRSPLPPGVLDCARNLQQGGWNIALHGLDMGAHAMANLVELEPALVTLDPALVSGVAADRRRLRSLVRLARALTAMGADIMVAGLEKFDDLQVILGLGIPHAWGPLFEGVVSAPTAEAEQELQRR
jgi:EAL domain-containing protein (putative c-di-GMP-specific phosphodiesterase class I)